MGRPSDGMWHTGHSISAGSLRFGSPSSDYRSSPSLIRPCLRWKMLWCINYTPSLQALEKEKMKVFKIGNGCYFVRAMARKRRLFRIADGAYLLAEERPKQVGGAEAERILRGMLEARRAGLGFVLT